MTLERIDTPRTRRDGTPWSLTLGMSLQRMDDVVTSNYKTLVASGVLLNKECTSFRYTCSARTSDYVGTWTLYSWPKENGVGSMSLGWMGSSVRPFIAAYPSEYSQKVLDVKLSSLETSKLGLITENEKRDALTAVSADVASGVASLLVSGAELDKTSAMICKALSLLRHPIRDAKRALKLTRKQMRTPKGRAAILDKANKLWLEGRYGWRPFVYDVMSWFDARSTPKFERYTARKRIKRSAKWTTYMKFGEVAHLGPILLRSDHSLTVIFRAGQLAEYSPRVDGYAQSFGLYDVGGAAWDLIPYSFVYDWFCNLGDALKSLQAYYLVQNRIGWSSLKKEYTIDHTPETPVPSVYVDPITRYEYMKIPIGDSFRETLMNYARTPVTSFLPDFTWRCRLDIAKIADLVALLRGLLR